MSIGRKNIFIRYYVIEKRKFLKKIGIEITDEEFENFRNILIKICEDLK
jgi:hypothetical protein